MAQDRWENTQYNLNIDASTLLPASPPICPFISARLVCGLHHVGSMQTLYPQPIPHAMFTAKLMPPLPYARHSVQATQAWPVDTTAPRLISHNYCKTYQDIHPPAPHHSPSLSLSPPRRRTLSKSAVIHPALGLDWTFLRHATAAEGTRSASRRSLTAMFRSIEHAHCHTHATGLRIRAAGTRLSPVRTQARGGEGEGKGTTVSEESVPRTPHPSSGGAQQAVLSACKLTLSSPRSSSLQPASPWRLPVQRSVVDLGS